MVVNRGENWESASMKNKVSVKDSEFFPFYYSTECAEIQRPTLTPDYFRLLFFLTEFNLIMNIKKYPRFCITGNYLLHHFFSVNSGIPSFLPGCF